MQHSSSTGGSLSRTASDNMLVVVAPYTSLGKKTVTYTLERMERTTNTVVFASCLNVVPVPANGMRQPVSDVSENARIEAQEIQVKGLNHCLKEIRPLFVERQVKLAIRASTGPSIESIVKVLASELHPRWIIFDRSLSSLRRKLERDPVLKHGSNLAFMLGSDVSITADAWFNSPIHVSEELSTRREAIVEETSYQTSSVGCCNGLFTFRQVSSSSSKRAVKRAEERTSFQMRQNP